MWTVAPNARSASAVADSLESLPATFAPRWVRIFAMPDIPAPPMPMKCGRSMAAGIPGAMRVSPRVVRVGAPSLFAVREELEHRYADLVTGAGRPVAMEELLHVVRGGQDDDLVGLRLVDDGRELVQGWFSITCPTASEPA